MSRKLFSCYGVSLPGDEENCGAPLYPAMRGLEKWLLSLNRMLSSFHSFTVYPRTSFFSVAEWFSQHGMLCFVFSVINNVILNINVKVLCRHELSFLLDLYSRVGQVYGNIILRHFRNCQTVSPQWLQHFSLSVAVDKCSYFSAAFITITVTFTFWASLQV